ncbi:MAG: cation diffusion facilitator family transporter [Myxococcales bacterium]|nr:cation diffusion facilitator family transporter [Myxococcales bacterium]
MQGNGSLHSARAGRRLTGLNVLISVVLAIPLTWIGFTRGTKLGLAQAADSVADSLTALALLYSLTLAARPADEDHPRGHQRAEPLAALFAAMMTGVLSFQVLSASIAAIRAGSSPTMDWPVAFVFTLKFVARLVMSVAAGRAHRAGGGPALRALQVDARNDTLVSGLALLGFLATRFGWAGWDAWLAIPVALWIAAAGLSLAQENVRLLMGEAAPPERVSELQAVAERVPGVDSVHGLTARYDGVRLEVSLHIVVDDTLSVRQAHDVAEAVEARLLSEGDVVFASVHVDVDAPG